MRKLSKKAIFGNISSGLIAFMGFVLLTVLTVVLISIISQTPTVCGNSNGIPVRYTAAGGCMQCIGSNTNWYWNTTRDVCCRYNGTDGTTLNTTNCKGYNTTDALVYGGAAANATQDLSSAAIVPPQFASLIVIVLIVVGVFGLLALLGYGAYQKMKNN